MDLDKDYYAILGVLPSAEDIVIKASYKALCQRYHPDKYSGSKDEATEKIKLINEAYSILSDPAKRKDYDNNRTSQSSNSDEFFDDENESGSDPLSEDWEFALEYYPELAKYEKRLAKISWKLAFSYRAYLLQEKQFDDMNLIADHMEAEFLKIYFGTNQQIIEFAKELIEFNYKNVAKELNKAVKILGGHNTSTKIINNLREKYHLPDVEVGKIYEGKVIRIMDFGAFVSVLPGKDGLLHISQISYERVKNVSDKLSEGEMVRVKVLEIDKQGRIRLSMKSADAAGQDKHLEEARIKKAKKKEGARCEQAKLEEARRKEEEEAKWKLIDSRIEEKDRKKEKRKKEEIDKVKKALIHISFVFFCIYFIIKISI